MSKKKNYRLDVDRGKIYVALTLIGLVALEAANYATTEISLAHFFGQEEMFGIFIADFIAIAFCSMDIAGIARIFTPEQGFDEPNEVKFFFGAWVMATIVNALFTWWSAVLVVTRNPDVGNELLSRADVIFYAPIVIAITVWLSRILIIGTVSMALDRMIWKNPRSGPPRRSNPSPAPRNVSDFQGLLSEFTRQRVQ